jgi:SulP family sulfate permease
MACLAGGLIIVSYNMSEWRPFRSLLKNPKGDVSILLVTFFLTVIFDLTIAIEIGLLIAMFIFMKRVSETTKVSVTKNSINLSEDSEIFADEERLVLPEGVEVYEIDGPFFFGIANKFDSIMQNMGDKPKIRIIRMRKVPFMDSTGLHNLESLFRLSKAENIQLILSGVNDSVRSMLIKSEFDKKIGAENICSNINKALNRAKELVEELAVNN